MQVFLVQEAHSVMVARIAVLDLCDVITGRGESMEMVLTQKILFRLW